MASKRGQRRRECGQKKRYENREHAASDARVLSGKSRQRVSAYKCPQCGQWHVGHTPRRVKSIIASRVREGA